ncbi:MAG: hypothetical protein ACRBB2_06595 [Nitrosopumilus sp.]
MIFPGERKTIDLIVDETVVISEIPQWITNNAMWWATGEIDDSTWTLL